MTATLSRASAQPAKKTSSNTSSAKAAAKADLAHCAIEYRIYPTDEQINLFERTFGCARKVWNLMLDDYLEFRSATDRSFVPTPACYKNEYPFLREVDSLALCNVQLDLRDAISRAKNRDLKNSDPKFKSKKKSKPSYTTNNINDSIRLSGNFIRLPKAGLVSANIHRRPRNGWKLKSATVRRTGSGKYFVSVLFEFPYATPDTIDPTDDRVLGIDYSSPHFYVDSEGNSIDMPHWYRESEAKLALLQRRLSRMVHGSKNHERLKRKIAILSEHIANQRRDFLHKLSHEITNRYDAVCLEDLDLQQMSRSLNFGKATHDNGFGKFRTMLHYKMERLGKSVIVIDKWYPSSKTCGVCGNINPNLKLGEMQWVCPCCGSTVDRDVNAAINIKNEGLRILRLRMSA